MYVIIVYAKDGDEDINLLKNENGVTYTFDKESDAEEFAINQGA